MDVVNEILRQGPLGELSSLYKRTILTLFFSIVVTLFIMLIILLYQGGQQYIGYGYLFTT